MGQNITKAVKGMVADANKEITTIPISDALNLVDSPNHIIVDLRDIRELQRTGKIPGAFSCPHGEMPPNTLYTISTEMWFHVK